MTLSAHGQFDLQSLQYLNGDVFISKTLAMDDGSLTLVGNLGTQSNFVVAPTIDGSEFLFIRYNEDLIFQWAKRLNAGSKGDGIIDALASRDGGYILFGSTDSDDGIFIGNSVPPTTDKNFFVAKLDSSTNVLWVQIYSCPNTFNIEALSAFENKYGEIFFSVRSDTSGGDFPMHYSNLYTYDIFVGKLDSAGNKLWVKVYGGQGTDETLKMKGDGRGGFYFCGRSSSQDLDLAGTIHSGFNGFLGRMDSSGAILWMKAFGGNSADWFNNIIVDTLAHQVVACGMSASIDGDLQGRGILHPGFDDDYWVVATDTLGNLKWSKWYGGTKTDVAITIEKNNANNKYLVSGYAYSKDLDVDNLHTQLNNDIDAWIISINPIDGSIYRKRNIGGNRHDAIAEIVSIGSRNLILGATNSSDFDFIDHTFNNQSYFLAELLDFPSSVNPANAHDIELKLYPQPVSNNLFIEWDQRIFANLQYALYRTNGQKVFSGSLEKYRYIDMSSIASGTYYLELLSENILIANSIISKQE